MTCPRPVPIYVLGELYPHRVLCGCGHCGAGPSDEALQREIERWLYEQQEGHSE